MSDYSIRWAFIGFCALAGSALFTALRISIDAASAVPRLGLVVLLLYVAFICGRLAKTCPGPRRALEVAGDFCHSLAQFVAAIAVIAPLSYLAAMPGLPLLDAKLASLDALLGFDWDSAARWVGERPIIDRLLHGAYLSLHWQPFVILLLGSIVRTGDRNREVIWLTALGLLASIAISAVTPAIGKVGPEIVKVIEAIRDGSWRVLDFEQFEGIVAFPSFHMASAVFLIYVVRQHRWALWISLPLNLLMMAATPTVGGHYLVDLLGGGAVAGATILLLRHADRRHPDSTARPAPAAFPEASLRAG